MLHSRRGVKLPMRKYLLQGSLICRGKLPMPVQGSLICRRVTYKSNPCPLGNWLTARQHSTLSTCIFGSKSKIEKISSTLSTYIFGSESKIEKIPSTLSTYIFGSESKIEKISSTLSTYIHLDRNQKGKRVEDYAHVFTNIYFLEQNINIHTFLT